MNLVLPVRLFGACLLLGAFALSPALASGPPTTGYTASYHKATSSVGHKPITSSEAVADAVLADALDQFRDMTDEHYHKGEYNHIVNLERIVVQGDPHDVEAFANGAFILWSSARNDEAVAFLKQGIRANPNTYYMYDELGQHYLGPMKDPAAAIPYFEQAVKFKCPFVTWHYLALCYEKTNQWEKAVSAWESAVKYPNDTHAPGRLARARAHLEQMKNEQKTKDGAH